MVELRDGTRATIVAQLVEDGGRFAAPRRFLVIDDGCGRRCVNGRAVARVL